MRRRLYAFPLIVATLAVLLSTVVMHHHHVERVCFEEEQCAVDGNVNDEHTSHRENEQDGCRVHQLHKFVIGVKTAQPVQKHAGDGWHAVADTVRYLLLPVDNSRPVAVEWQECAAPLSERACTDIYRRGPPLFS